MTPDSPMPFSTTAAPSPRVAIVLVNYRGWRDTVECLDSLLALRYPAFHVFVVDNESPDDSVARITPRLREHSRAG
jgi:GT2 family glycosyltransferase